MTEITTDPLAEGITTLLRDVLGVEGSRAPAPTAPLQPPKQIAVAGYSDARGDLCAAWICDRAFLAYSAAHLLGAEAATVEQALRGATFPAAFADAVEELLAIGSRVFVEHAGREVRLDGLHWGSGAVPDSVRALMASPDRRVDLLVPFGPGIGRAVVLLGSTTREDREPQPV